MVGTAAYMSPEQALGRGTDERSDIFSFGVVLYEMATGRPAFVGPTPMEVLDAVLHAEPEPVAKARPDLPLELSMVVQKALRKDPSQRYQHMSELRADVHRLQTAGGAAPVLMHHRRQLRGALTLTAVAGVIVVVTAVLWSGMPALREPSEADPINEGQPSADERHPHLRLAHYAGPPVPCRRIARGVSRRHGSARPLRRQSLGGSPRGVEACRGSRPGIRRGLGTAW